MKKEIKFEIEIERNNVTPSQFLSYVRQSVDKKGGNGLRSDLDLRYFVGGYDLNFNTKHKEPEFNGLHEVSVSKPYQMQTYLRDDEGNLYNEICEFDFDDEKKGHGYYYLINVNQVEVKEETAEEIKSEEKGNEAMKEYEFKTTERYDYHEAVTSDIINYLVANYTTEELADRMTDKSEFANELQDILWLEDSVTGNASGSYWISTWKAEEALCHNWDLILDMVGEFGVNLNSDNSAEYLDVSIRCFILSECIWTALEEIENSGYIAEAQEA